MTNYKKIPINRADDGELMGFIFKDSTGWQAQTIFGYLITRTKTEAEADTVVREQGLKFLTGVWQYFDQKTSEWQPCILKEAHENRVTIITTNFMGYQDPDNYEIITIKNPSETNLIKA